MPINTSDRADRFMGSYIVQTNYLFYDSVECRIEFFMLGDMCKDQLHSVRGFRVPICI